MAGLMKAKEVQLATGKVRYFMGGSGPGLLLCHSAYGDAETCWHRVWNELAQSFTVIAPDLPGFGFSEALDRPSTDNFARVLKELMDEAGLKEVLIAGNSFSANLVLRFAELFPDRVSRVVMVNGTPPPVLPLPLRFLLSLPGIKSAFIWVGKKFIFSPTVLKRAFAHPEDVPIVLMKKIKSQAKLHARLVTENWLLQRQHSEPPKQPLGLIWGADDKLVPLTQGQKLHEWAHGSILVAIPDAGHMPQIEQPKLFVEALDHFAGVEFHKKAA